MSETAIKPEAITTNIPAPGGTARVEHRKFEGFDVLSVRHGSVEANFFDMSVMKFGNVYVHDVVKVETQDEPTYGGTRILITLGGGYTFEITTFPKG